MPAIRITLAIIMGLVAVPRVATADDDGSRSRRPRLIDSARIRQLADVLRSDSDERRRKAAVNEMSDADPRVHPEVMPSLIAALRNGSAAVRASAAETIGRFRTVFPLAGAALEQAAESDPSPDVRSAAKQSLWEYHLNGYKSQKGAEVFRDQTAEPPFARPVSARRPITTEPTLAEAIPVSGATLPTPPIAVPLPPAALPPGPRVSPFVGIDDPRRAILASPRADATSEPPIAEVKQPRVPTPKLTAEPPLLRRWPEPVMIGQSPNFTLELPPIVTPPDAK